MKYQEVKYVKAKIDELKGQILEGVQIRSKVQEIKYGEMPSSFLVGKLKSEGTKKTIYRLKAEQSCGHINLNEEIDKTDDIKKYVHSYFGNLYKYQQNEILEQSEFLNCLENKVSDSDNETLTTLTSLEEIYKALDSTEDNKSPGIDG